MSCYRFLAMFTLIYHTCHTHLVSPNCNWKASNLNLVVYLTIRANVLVLTTNRLFQIENKLKHVRSFFACCVSSDTTWFKIGSSPEDVLRSLTSCVLHIQPSLPRTAPKIFRSLLEAMAAVEPLHTICECILKLCYWIPKHNKIQKFLYQAMSPPALLPFHNICQLIRWESEDNERGTNMSVAKVFRSGVVLFSNVPT